MKRRSGSYTLALLAYIPHLLGEFYRRHPYSTKRAITGASSESTKKGPLSLFASFRYTEFSESLGRR